MSRLGKTIISLVSAGLVAVAGILLYVFWPAITGTINKNKYYTAEDVQTSYDKGFNDGNKSETELTAEITYYKTLVDDYEAEVNSLNKELSELISIKNTNEETIANLTTIKNENEETIERLQGTIDKNNTEIESYKEHIANLNLQITTLQNSNINNQAEINNLRNQVSNYQTIVNQLQNTNDMNIQTINSLNSQITALNSQISDLEYELSNNSNNVEELEKTIIDLQKSITYYESYIAQLETETQVVATFEYDGSVYNVQILTKGAKVSVVTPDDTEYMVFNGWKVNGEFVDLTNYQISTNTKFVADITYKHKVSFVSNGETVETKYIVTGSKTSAPTISREGFEFDGWTVNGKDIVNVSNYVVNKDTTFRAVWTQIHTITFLYEDEIVSTQLVRNGEFAKNVSVENTTYKQFNGWMINNAIVDVSNYKISSSVVFNASITYSYDVQFIVDESLYNSQIVLENNFVIVPNNPSKQSYRFEGWSIDGTIIDLTTYRITKDTSFIAIFTYMPAGLFASDGTMTMSWDELIENNYFVVTENNELKKGSNSGRSTMTGDLYVHPEITGFTQDYSSASYATFYDCKALNSIILPEGLTSIPSNTFSNCESLTNIEIPSSVTTIGEYAFAKCKALKTIKLPEAVTVIERNTFNYCEALETIEFSTQLSSIKNEAFSYCKSLKNFIFPESLTYLGSKSFYYCSSLDYVYIPETLESMSYTSSSYSPFYYANTSLTIFIEPDSIPSTWDSDIFYVNSYTRITPKYGTKELIIGDMFYYIDSNNDKHLYRASKDLTEVLIDEDTKYIEDKAVYNNIHIEYLHIPESVVSIGKNAFSSCINLKEINIPSQVTILNDYTFSGCSSLTSIIIPEHIVQLGAGVFSSCIGLRYVYIPSSITAMSGSSYSGAPFYNCDSKLMIYCQGTSQAGKWGSSWYYYASEKKLNYVEKVASVSVENDVIYYVDTSGVKHLNRAYSFDIVDLVISDDTIVIDKNAMWGCSKLQTITMSTSVQRILGSSISESPFYECTSLNAVYITSIEHWVTINFTFMYSNPLYYAHNLYLNGELVVDLVIPDTVTKLEGFLFVGCTHLETVYIPSSVETIYIGDYQTDAPFMYCTTQPIIYCEAETKPEGWTGGRWNWNNSSPDVYLTANMGYTLDEYYAAIGEE